MKFPDYCRTVLVLGGIGMSVLSLQGCATSGHAGMDGSPQVGDEEQVSFPAPEDAWLEEGGYVNMENLRKMQEGLSKDQVYDLLGRPHFSEGLFGVDTWNYILHLPTGNGSYMTCQYQVQFDDDMLTTSFHWREPDCAAVVEPDEVKTVRVSLSADTLFEFDSIRVSPEGRKQVSRFAERIRRDFTDPEVVVLGHTDRLGSEDYNLMLSDQRAAMVRSILISEGIAPASIHSIGVGERQPVTRCEGSRVSPELKACLQPDRRVEVEVSGKVVESM